MVEIWFGVRQLSGGSVAASTTRPKPLKRTQLAAAPPTLAAVTVTPPPPSPAAWVSTILGATVGLGAVLHEPLGSSPLTTQEPAVEASVQVASTLRSSAPVTSQNVTVSLLRMASVRAFCRPACIDSAALRTRVLRSHSVIDGTAAPSRSTNTVSVTAISIMLKPRWADGVRRTAAAAWVPISTRSRSSASSSCSTSRP